MDFCQQLSSKGMTFTFSLSMGPLFHFSLDTKEKSTPVLGVGKVKKIPSTMKRNAKRRQDFLMKKSDSVTLPNEDISSQSTVEKDAANYTLRDIPAYLENTSKQKNDLKCESCNYTNQSKKQLKTHIARKHMEYQCDICSYGTTTEASLQTHMAHVHPSSSVEDNSLSSAVEGLKEDVTVRSSDVVQIYDKREPLANSTLETERELP